MTMLSRKEEKSPITTSTKLEKLELEGEELNLTMSPVKEKATEATKDSTCTTPTAKEYKIPNVMTCPPAPRKRKAPFSAKGKAMKKFRVAKEFFASPELEAVLGINVRVSSKIELSCTRYR